MKILVYSTFENTVIFARLISALQKALKIINISFPGENHIILRIDNILLKVEMGSNFYQIYSKYREKKEDFDEGRNKLLQEKYLEEGIRE